MHICDLGEEISISNEINFDLSLIINLNSGDYLDPIDWSDMQTCPAPILQDHVVKLKVML